MNVGDASLAHKQICYSHIDTQAENKRNFEFSDDLMNLHRVAVNETTLISEITSIIYEVIMIIVLGQGKNLQSILHDDYCEELAFLYLFPREKLAIR